MKVEFDQTRGRLTFSDPDQTDSAVEACTAWLRYHFDDGIPHHAPLIGLGASIHEVMIEDAHGMGMQWMLHGVQNPEGIQLNYQINSYPHHPFVLLRISSSNRSKVPVYLDELCLFQASPSNGGQVRLGIPEEGYRFLKIGWHGWDYTGWRSVQDRNRLTWMDSLTALSYSNPATPKPTGRGQFCSEGWAVFKGRQAAVVTGLASTGRQFGQVYASLQPGSEALMLVCQVDGIRLDPGEGCDSEWGYLQFVPPPWGYPEADYIDTVARHMHARVPATPPPPMWTHWYQFYHDINEQRFIQNMDQLVEQRDVVPYRVVELDDGYQRAWGDWTVTNAKFPHGLEWLSQQVQSRGITPGIWLAPFAVQAGSQLARQHPEWLVRNRRGKPARVGFLYNMFIHALDLTHPEVEEHLVQLTRTFSQEWGFRMLKIDFLNCAALPGKRHNPKLTRAEALRKGLEAIREGVGEDTFLLGCGCPFGPAVGLVDAMRIGPDTAPSWEPYFHWISWASPLIRKNPSIPALRNALRNSVMLSRVNREWWWNDPDCLIVRDKDTRQTEAEVQTTVSLLGLLGGMLVSSDDLAKVSRQRLKWASLLIPNLELAGVPLGSGEYELPEYYQVKVEHLGQKWQLVAIFNWSDHAADCRLRFSDIGFTAGTQLHLFDFWAEHYQQVSGTDIEFVGIPPHGCKLLRISAVEEKLQLVGDTMHISQGKELSKLRIAKDFVVVETADLGRRVQGALWLALDRRPKAVRHNGERVSINEGPEGIYSFEVEGMGLARFEIEL